MSRKVSRERVESKCDQKKIVETRKAKDKKESEVTRGGRRSSWMKVKDWDERQETRDEETKDEWEEKKAEEKKGKKKKSRTDQRKDLRKRDTQNR